MIVVFWIPSEEDPSSGRITECRDVPLSLDMVLDQPFIEVPEVAKWDCTHEVKNFAVVPRDPEIISAEKAKFGKIRVRVLRDAGLKDGFDPYYLNDLRWDGFTEEQKAAMLDWRQQMLDWTDTETDFDNPTAPPPPEFLKDKK